MLSIMADLSDSTAETKFGVVYYSHSEEDWVIFSMHNTRPEAEKIHDSLMDFIADAPGRFTLVRIQTFTSPRQ